VLLFPDDRSSHNDDVNTDSSLEHPNVKATTTSSTTGTEEANKNTDSVLKQLAEIPLLRQDDFETTVQQGLKQGTAPIILSPISAVSVFQQSPSTRKFDADWKTSLQVRCVPPSFLSQFRSNLFFITRILFEQGYRLRFFSPDELIRLFGFINIDHFDSAAEQNEEKERTGFFPPGMNCHYDEFILTSLLTSFFLFHLLRRYDPSQVL